MFILYRISKYLNDVFDLFREVVEVAAGENHSLVLTSSSNMYACGFGDYG